MKIDHNQEFLKHLNIIQEENIWLLQVCQEEKKDLMGCILALTHLRKFKYLDFNTVDLLIKMLNQSSTDICIREKIIDILLKIPDKDGNRYSDNLLELLGQLKINNDGSLKSNNFSQKKDYQLTNYIIRGIWEI